MNYDQSTESIFEAMALDRNSVRRSNVQSMEQRSLLTTKLYIGNLPFNVTQAQLEDLFRQAGEVVDVYLATDRYTSKSSGFAFVHMATEEEGRKAIELFHGYSLSDRPMTVQEVKNSEAPEWKGSSGTVIFRKLHPPVIPEKPEGRR